MNSKPFLIFFKLKTSKDILSWTRFADSCDQARFSATAALHHEYQDNFTLLGVIPSNIQRRTHYD